MGDRIEPKSVIGFIRNMQSRNNLDKMLSNKAVSKSETASDHASAIANLDIIFEGATLGWSKPDRNKDTNIQAINT